MAELRRFVFQNFSRSTLAARITASATQLRLAEGEGDRFPSPDGTYDEIFALIVTNGPQYEVMYCTARAGDILTVERGKEGSTAQLFNASSNVVHNATAEFFSQLSRLQAILTSLNPATATLEGGIQEIEIIGEDFHPDAVVYVNGTTRVASVDSDTSILFDLTEADVAALGTLEVTVVNPDTLPSNALELEVVEALEGIEFLGFDFAESLQSGTTQVTELELDSYLVDTTNRAVLGQFILSNGNVLTGLLSAKVEVVDNGTVRAVQNLNLGDGQVVMTEVYVLADQISIAIPNDVATDGGVVLRMTTVHSGSALRRHTTSVGIWANVDQQDVQAQLGQVENVEDIDSDDDNTVAPFVSDTALVWSSSVIGSFDNVLEITDPLTFTLSDFDEVATTHPNRLAYWIADADIPDMPIVWTPAVGGDFCGHFTSAQIVFPYSPGTETSFNITVANNGGAYGYETGVFGASNVEPAVFPPHPVYASVPQLAIIEGLGASGEGGFELFIITDYLYGYTEIEIETSTGQIILQFASATDFYVDQAESYFYWPDAVWTAADVGEVRTITFR